jgi:hypothetical protein
MKTFIKNKLNESLVFELIETLIDEDYPSTWDIDEFKKLNSFSARIRYCEEHLTRISSGTSRIVYKIDDEKVLKLAKNKKGLSQNEVESQHSKYYDLDDILARVYEHDKDNLWVEMELARKVRTADFNRITGFSFRDFSDAVYNYGNEVKGRGHNYMRDIPPSVVEDMWEDEFTYAIFNYIGNYDIHAGDLTRLSTYGIVKGDGDERVVIIDYGLDDSTYQSYYS